MFTAEPREAIAMDDNTGSPPRPKKLNRKQRRAAKREDAQRRYFARKEAGECIRCGKPVDGDSLWCAEHREAEIEIRRVAARARRARLRRARCCPECGHPKGDQNTVVLPAITAPARWHTEGRKAKVRQITEGDGRTRNRGSGQARRGRMSRAAEDEQDMRGAQAELEAANRALAHAHSPEVKAMGAIPARALLLAALDRVDLAVRFLGEILARHNYLR